MVSFSNFGRSATKKDIQSSEVVLVLLSAAGYCAAAGPGAAAVRVCCRGGAGAVLWSYDALLLAGMLIDFRCGTRIYFISFILHSQVPVV